MIMAPSVYILLHRDPSGTPTIISVYAELPDANAACLQQAAEAKVEAKVLSPRDLQRWEDADGTSCWVEKHTVVTRQSGLAPTAPSPKRKNSSLYDSEEDDAIEVQDKDGQYD